MPEQNIEIYRQRPEVQRTEIGPVFHDLAHKVYGALEQEIADGQLDVTSPHDSYTDSLKINVMLQRLGMRAAQLAAGIGGEVLALFRSQILDTPIARDNKWPTNYFAQRPVTIPSDAVVTEGVRSGIIMPYRLYESMLYAPDIESRNHHFADDYEYEELDRNIDLTSAADTITQPNFLKMLHQLAHAPNGFLGSVSTNFVSKPLTCFTGRMPSDVFDMEDGQVTGFSEAFLDLKATHLHLATETRMKEPSHYSGGCPVRHESFPKLGEHATRYLKEVNPDGRPYHEGESAITHGARLTSFALRHTAANREAA